MCIVYICIEYALISCFQLPQDPELIGIAYHRTANSAYGLDNMATMNYCWSCLRGDEGGITVVECEGPGCPRIYCLPCADMTEDTIPDGPWLCPACVNCLKVRQEMDDMTPAERMEANAVVSVYNDMHAVNTIYPVTVQDIS